MRRGILDKGSGKRTEEFMNVIQDLIRKESLSTQIGAELANLKQTYNTIANATKTYHSTNWVQLQLLTADARRNLIQRFVEYPVPADYASMSLPDRRAYFDGILFERITVSRHENIAQTLAKKDMTQEYVLASLKARIDRIRSLRGEDAA